MELHRDTPSLLQIGLIFLRLVLQPPFFQQNNLEDFLSDAPTYMYLEQHSLRQKPIKAVPLEGSGSLISSSQIGNTKGVVNEASANDAASVESAFGAKKSIVKMSTKYSKQSQDDDEDGKNVIFFNKAH
jgi:hypothetical protein